MTQLEELMKYKTCQSLNTMFGYAMLYIILFGEHPDMIYFNVVK